MGKIAIRTERLGKKYRLGTQQQKYTGYDILGFDLDVHDEPFRVISANSARPA